MEGTFRLSQLMSLTCGGERPQSRAQETMLAIIALVAGLALSSLWGLAVGGASSALSLANAYKVPMVILASALTGLPPALVTLRLMNARLASAELAAAFATSVFGGTLVLATLAPLVAIYYHTSSTAGIPLAIGSVFVALAIASLLFVRSIARRVGGQQGRSASLLAVIVLVTMFVLALLQFVAVASPIIGHGTVFDGGFDTMFGGH